MTSKAAHGGSLEENAWQAIFQGVNQALAYTGTAALSAAVSARVNIVRLTATTDCFIKIGQGSPVATSSDTLLPAGIVDHFCVNEGDKISVIRRTSNGILHITEGYPVDPV